MSNSITAANDPALLDLDMNNGLTSVFLSVLLLSGSALAQDAWEIATVAWLAEHDQSVVGSGVVGFDVSEMGWSQDRHARHQAFLLGVIDGALARHGWERLGYAPNEEWLIPSLAALREMIRRFPQDACPDRPRRMLWSVGGPRTDGARCARHLVYLHGLMTDDTACCLLCNDEGVTA